MWLQYYSDGTSLVVSDEVGQIYIFGTGSKMSEKDVKYDQVRYFQLLFYSWFCMLSHHIVLSFDVLVLLLCDLGALEFWQSEQWD